MPLDSFGRPLNSGTGNSPTAAPSNSPSQPSIFARSYAFVRNNARKALGGAALAGATVAAIGVGVWAKDTSTTPAEYVQGVLAQPQLNADGAREAGLVAEARSNFQHAQEEDNAIAGLLIAGKSSTDAEVQLHINQRNNFARIAVEKIGEAFGKNSLSNIARADSGVATTDGSTPDSGVVSRPITWEQWAEMQNPIGGTLNQALSAYNLFLLAQSLRWANQPRTEYVPIARLMLAETRAKGWADFEADAVTCGIEGSARDPNRLDRLVKRGLLNNNDITSEDRANLRAYCESAGVSFNPGITADAQALTATDAVVSTEITDAGSPAAPTTTDSGVSDSDVMLAADTSSVPLPNATNDARTPEDTPSAIANPPDATTF